MGIAYLLMLIVYIALAKGIYSIIVRPTTKVWIKRSLIAFFILLPTYDIIIGNALKFYYCQFTELEKINKTIERPEGILLEDRTVAYYNQQGNISEAETYIDFLKLKYVQIKRKNDHIRTYVSTGEYIDHNNARRLKIEESNNSSLKSRYVIIENYLSFSWFVDKFIQGSETKIVDLQTNETIVFAKDINHKKYNFITIDTGFLFKGKWCGGDTYAPYLVRKIIKDKK